MRGSNIETYDVADENTKRRAVGGPNDGRADGLPFDGLPVDPKSVALPVVR